MSEATTQSEYSRRTDLESRVLVLDAPIWSIGRNNYEADQMAARIVDLLAELRANLVDRSQHPEIATFVADRIEFDGSNSMAVHDQFNLILGQSILTEAAKKGLDVAVISHIFKNNQATADRLSKSVPEETKVGPAARLRKLFRHPGEKPIETQPEFILQFTAELTGEESPDFQRNTWSYKNVRHTVRLVPPGSLTIEYFQLQPTSSPPRAAK